MTRFGFELEVAAGARSVSRQLIADGLMSPEFSGLHRYHCGCDYCRPADITARGYVFKAQADCTANGEFITGILEYDTPQADRAFAGISRALLLAGARVSGDVGNHVHVEDNLDPMGKVRLTRLFARYQRDLFEVAAAVHDRVRDYNCELYAPLGHELWDDTRAVNMASGYGLHLGTMMSWKGSTVEFRLWNATKAEWRLRTHVGLSIGMYRAAEAGVNVNLSERRPFEAVVGPFLDAPAWAGLLRQRHSKGGFAA